MIRNRDELVALLLRGKVDLSKWGTGRWKSIDHALGEIKDNDIRPFFNEATGRVVFYRQRVFGLCKTPGYTLLEVERWNPVKERFLTFRCGPFKWKGFRKWDKIVQVQEYALSETVRVNQEHAIGALIRAVREEWRIRIDERQCQQISLLADPLPPPRASRVYFDVDSAGMNEYVEFRLTKRPCRENPILQDGKKDGRVFLFLKWFPSGKEQWYLRWEREILSFVIRKYVTVYALFC